MKQYFLHDGQNQIGPFSIEELKERNISSETFIWKEGMSDWVKAGDIDELKTMLASTPPPFKAAANVPHAAPPFYQKQPETDSYKTGNWIGRNWKFLVVLGVITIIGAIIINNNSKSTDTGIDPLITDSITEIETPAKTPEELRRELESKERNNPVKYLEANLTRRKNLVGENVFEGTITNTASVAVFKDIKIKITYLSKTKSVIGTDSFIVYETIGPKGAVPIKKKYFPPDDTDGYSVDIVGAEAEN